MSRSFVRALSVSLLLSITACKKDAPVENAADLNTMSTRDTTASHDTVPKEVVDEMIANFSRVHFEVDSSALNTTSQAALARNAELMMAHMGVAIEVEGHADERGTTDYNLALGARRADAVRTFLVQSGIAANRVRTTSYGEERPLASGHDEVAWSQNRRAEFRIITGQGVAGTSR